MTADRSPAKLDASRFADVANDEADLGSILPRDTTTPTGPTDRGDATVTSIPSAPAKPRRRTATPARRPATKTTRGRAAPSTQPGARTDARAKKSAVHIPASLSPRINALQRKTGWKNHHVLIQALEYCHRAELFPQLFQETVGGGLFPVLHTAGATQNTGDRNFPFTIYMNMDLYKIFDDLVQKSGARNHSHLASVALTAYLDSDEAKGIYEEDG